MQENVQMKREKRQETSKQKNTFRGDKSEGNGGREDEEVKRYRHMIKQNRQSKTFQNNERKFYQQVLEECRKTYQKLDAKETKQFWSKL